MKVLPFKIPKPEDDALIFQEDRELIFYNKLHQHEEIQISLIVKGEGTLIVGDTINYYEQGDILVIGGHLPHVFKSDLNATSNSHMLSLFFTRTSFGTTFFELEELQEISLFFNRAKNGFRITSSKETILALFFELKEASKFDRFILLLKLLKLISSSNYKSLSSFIYEKKYSDIEGKRIGDVFEYTMTNYQKDISLDAISEIATMTKNAFCKYFKKRTNKTYFQFLNELRIEYACKLLLANNEFSIAEIAFKSGFNNISNFNRQFKSIKDIRPSEYKK